MIITEDIELYQSMPSFLFFYIVTVIGLFVVAIKTVNLIAFGGVKPGVDLAVKKSLKQAGVPYGQKVTEPKSGRSGIVEFKEWKLLLFPDTEKIKLKMSEGKLGSTLYWKLEFSKLSSKLNPFLNALKKNIKHEQISKIVTVHLSGKPEPSDLASR